MNTKLIVLIVVLLVAAAVSVYVWTSTGQGQSGDPKIAGQMEKFTCNKCGKTFEKGVQAVTQERRAHDGHMYCPLCGAEDPEKQDVKVRLGGMGRSDGEEAKGFDSDRKEGGDEGETKEPPKVAPPTIRKKKTD